MKILGKKIGKRALGRAAVIVSFKKQHSKPVSATLGKIYEDFINGGGDWPDVEEWLHREGLHLFRVAAQNHIAAKQQSGEFIKPDPDIKIA